MTGETAIKQTIKPLELAYREYMRTFTGCMRSTPIPLLHAISRFPLLKDKILTDSALTVIKAEAQGNLLGKDYREWDHEGCSVDGWTPFGQVRYAIEKTIARKFEARIHPQQIIPMNTLEALNKCKFHTHTREAANELHTKGLLIPQNTDVAIWTDGSLTRTGHGNGDADIETGAAAIVNVSNWEEHGEIVEHPITESLQIENAVSSYEAEIIAIQAGLDIIVPLRLKDRHIHFFTDSLSCIQQLATLPFKYKYTNAVVHSVTEKLAELTEQNEVEIHFVPSHTEEPIAQSEEIDKLAKDAALDGTEVDHDPFVSSYTLMLKKREKIKLQKYLQQNIKPSQFTNYPDRTLLRKGQRRILQDNGEDKFVPINNSHSLLNRVRTGHTRSRVHLKNIKIESDNICRHCNRHRETIEHQLIRCKKYKRLLKKFRDKYKELDVASFEDALYTHDAFMADFLNRAYENGCYI